MNKNMHAINLNDGNMMTALKNMSKGRSIRARPSEVAKFALAKIAHLEEVIRGYEETQYELIEEVTAWATQAGYVEGLLRAHGIDPDNPPNPPKKISGGENV